MSTPTEFLVPTDRDDAGDALGPQLEPTPVNGQPASITITRIAPFDGMAVETVITDGQNERTTRSSGVGR